MWKISILEQIWLIRSMSFRIWYSSFLSDNFNSSSKQNSSNVCVSMQQKLLSDKTTEKKNKKKHKQTTERSSGMDLAIHCKRRSKWGIFLNLTSFSGAVQEVKHILYHFNSLQCSFKNIYTWFKCKTYKNKTKR